MLREQGILGNSGTTGTKKQKLCRSPASQRPWPGGPAQPVNESAQVGQVAGSGDGFLPRTFSRPCPSRALTRAQVGHGGGQLEVGGVVGGDADLDGASPLVHHLVDANLEHLPVPQGPAAQHHAVVEVVGGTEGIAKGASALKAHTPSGPELRPAMPARHPLPKSTSYTLHSRRHPFSSQEVPCSTPPAPHVPAPNPTRAPSQASPQPRGPYWGLRAVRPSWVMAAFCPQLGWKSRRSGSAWAAGAARRRAPSGDSARRMALFRRRRSLWLLLWTMVTFTAIPYKSTTPYTTGGVSGVATPAGAGGAGKAGKGGEGEE